MFKAVEPLIVVLMVWVSSVMEGPRTGAERGRCGLQHRIAAARVPYTALHREASPYQRVSARLTGPLRHVLRSEPLSGASLLAQTTRPEALRFGCVKRVKMVWNSYTDKRVFHAWPLTAPRVSSRDRSTGGAELEPASPASVHSTCTSLTSK